MICVDCGDEYVKPSPDEGLIVAGGWCAPSEVVYAMPEPPPRCSDCRSRWQFMIEYGFDPGRHGENLRVPRGGIRFPRPG